MDNESTDADSLEEAVGKEKPFSLWLKWFLPTAVAVFVGLAGTLQFFDVWKLIFQTGTWWPWLCAFAISILTAALASTIRLVLYYLHVYRVYRDKALVDNLYADRSILQGKYEKLINEAEKRVTISGISLHTLLQNPDTRAAIVRAACEKKVHFRFLLHSPDCKFIRARASQEGKPEDHIVKDCELHLSQLNEIKAQCSAGGGPAIEVKVIKDKMPDCFFFQIDEKLFIEPYLLGYTGRDCPVLSLKRNKINSVVFDSFSKKIDYKWNKLAEPA